MNPADTTCEPTDGEPALLFHEFIFLLGLIAIQFMTGSSQTSEQIENFFVEKLNFTKIDPDTKLKTYDELKDDSGIYSDEESSGSELEMDEQQKAFMEFLQERAAQDASFMIDFNEVLSVLDEALPMIPGKPEV